MKNETARILVASDDATEAQLITHSLERDFACVRAMVSDQADPAAIADYAPAVLLLAINGVSRAEQFVRGLSAPGAVAQPFAFRTILFCTREEIAVAFNLCRQGQFDDYVMYWPSPFDGMRMTMSVLLACRDSNVAPRLDTPATGDLIAHAISMDAVDNAIDAALSEADRALLEPHLSKARQLAQKIRQMRLALMVVEDDPLACQVIEHILKDQPVDLMFAADARVALSSLRRRKADLILMDVRLPGMDGIALTRLIKATPGFSEIPVIMLTGSAKRETVAASMGAGADGFLVKPLTRDGLLAKIQAYLPNRAGQPPRG